jgi:uncharacterized repeat protein (TIGR01451 family)
VSLHFGCYQNFGDGLVPAPGALPFVWGDRGMASGLANSDSAGGWRVVFWSVPFEKMGEPARQAAMNGVVGWLSDLGDSSFTAGRRVALPGEIVTYSLTLRAMESAGPLPVAITNTLPEGLEIRPGSIRGGAEYNEPLRQLTWAGTLASGSEHRIIYRAKVAGSLPSGARLDNTVNIWEGHHQLAFDKTVPLWVDAPDLSRSSLSAFSGNRPEDEDGDALRFVTYTLRLENSGLAPARPATATLHLPGQLTSLAGTLDASAGTAALEDGRLEWQGVLRPGETVTVSLTLSQTLQYDVWLPATAVLSDGVTDVLVRDGLYYPATRRSYFPLFTR